MNSIGEVLQATVNEFTEGAVGERYAVQGT